MYPARETPARDKDKCQRDARTHAGTRARTITDTEVHWTGEDGDQTRMDSTKSIVCLYLCWLTTEEVEIEKVLGRSLVFYGSFSLSPSPNTTSWEPPEDKCINTLFRSAFYLGVGINKV